MSEVYLVTKGEYSDYRVEAVFSTKENAERFMAKFPNSGWGGYNEIEVYSLDEHISEIERGLIFFRVEISRDGDTLSIEQTSPAYQSGDPIPDGWRPYYYRGGSISGRQEIKWRPFYTWAKDEQHAVKIANEWRVQMIAMEVA